MVEWAANDYLMLNSVPQPKGTASFTSGTGTNLDLAFVSAGPDNRLPGRCVLEKFPWSQNQCSLITAANLMAPVPSEPVKQWKFHKADWNHYSLLTNEATQGLASSSITNVEEAYQDFRSAIIKAAKRSIPYSRINNYILCWDKKCGSFIFITPF